MTDKMDTAYAIKALRRLMEPNKPKYQLFSFDQHLKDVKELAENAASIIDLSPENCKILLYHFKWDSRELTEKYFEASSFTTFLKKHNIKLISKEALEEDMEVVDKCQMCEETKEVASLSCSHLVCFDCWKNIIKNLEYAQTRKPTLPYITCNFEDCDAPIPETFALQLFRDPETYHLYQLMVVNSYVESNPKFKWCPTRKKDCDKAIKATDADYEEITCTCGFTYCFDCEDLPHSPFPCTLIKTWQEEVECYKSYIENSTECHRCNKVIWHPHKKSVCCNCGYNFSNDTETKDRERDKIHPEFKKYLHHLKHLQYEFEQISKLEDDKSKEFWLLVIKFVTDCRQKFLNFFAFIHYVENLPHTFQINQDELEFLFKKAERQVCYLASGGFYMTYPPNNEKNIIDTILLPMSKRLKSHLDSIWEESWTFNDETVKRAFQNA